MPLQLIRKNINMSSIAIVPRNRSMLVGRALSALVSLALLADATVILVYPELMQVEMDAIGFPAALSVRLGLIILVCASLYTIPRTALWGAVLTTGFLGGAICMHFRVGEFGSPPQLVALALGIAAWAGLYLTDDRVKSLLGGHVPLASAAQERS